jgi:hypothetical protein
MNIPVLMGKKWLLPALVVGAVVLVGIGIRGSGERAMEDALERATGGDADVDYDGDGNVRVRTEEGEWSTGGELPKDWPSDVAIYGGATVLYSASADPATGERGFYAALQSTDAAAEVAAWYQQRIAADGWTVASTTNVNGATYLGAEKDGRTLAVSVTPAEGGSSIMLGVAEEKN